MPESQKESEGGWGAMIRERRLEKGWTQKELGDRVGCTFGHLSEIERENNRPGRKLCLRLSEVLDLNKDYLLGAAGHAAPDVVAMIAAEPTLADEVRKMAASR